MWANASAAPHLRRVGPAGSHHQLKNPGPSIGHLPFAGGFGARGEVMSLQKQWDRPLAVRARRRARSVLLPPRDRCRMGIRGHPLTLYALRDLERAASTGPGPGPQLEPSSVRGLGRSPPRAPCDRQAARLAVARTVSGPTASLVLGPLTATFGIRGLAARLILASLAASLRVRSLAAHLVFRRLAAGRSLRRPRTCVILRRTP